MYINLKGREAKGIVDPGQERDVLKRELIEKLTGHRDDESGETAIRAVFDGVATYTGPYSDNAPDLIIGYNDGYRASWKSVVGTVTDSVFEENQKSWSGDHCIDPALVPGVLFCNRTLKAENPAIVDIAPTVLKLFGVDVPPYIEERRSSVTVARRSDPARADTMPRAKPLPGRVRRGGWSRRRFLAGGSGLLASPSLLTSCSGNSGVGSAKRVLVLGIDGLDPLILGRLIQLGTLPNFGGCRTVATSRSWRAVSRP